MRQLFQIPTFYPNAYVVGPQVFNPGEPNSSFPAVENRKVYWPNAVHVINLLIGNPGQARGYPVQQQITGVALLPSDNLYLGGFVGKSLG